MIEMMIQNCVRVPNPEGAQICKLRDFPSRECGRISMVSDLISFGLISGELCIHYGNSSMTPDWLHEVTYK